MAAVRDLKIGNQEAEETFIGPMARYDLRDEMNGQVQPTIDGGAAVLLGGNKIDGPGNYYEPTILSNVAPGMVSFDQEIFGPVASLITANDVEVR